MDGWRPQKIAAASAQRDTNHLIARLTGDLYRICPIHVEGRAAFARS
jgi:hypothetical protein